MCGVAVFLWLPGLWLVFGLCGWCGLWGSCRFRIWCRLRWCVLVGAAAWCALLRLLVLFRVMGGAWRRGGRGSRCVRGLCGLWVGRVFAGGLSRPGVVCSGCVWLPASG